MDRLTIIALGLLGTLLFSVAELSCIPPPLGSPVIKYMPTQTPNYGCIFVNYKPDEPFEKDYSQSVYFLTNSTASLGSASVSPSPSPAPQGTS